MKEKRHFVDIDKDLHKRIKHLIRIHPELEFKIISKFVNKATEEKLNKIEDHLTSESIRKAGLDEFINKTKMIKRKIPGIIRFYEEYDDERIKADRKKMKLEDQIQKRKHTHRVYTPKKK